MKSKLFTALIVSATFLTVQSTKAQNSVPPAATDTPAKAKGAKHEGHGHHMEALTKELNLTTDQQAKIKAIFEASRPEIKALRDDTTMAPKDRHSKMKAIHEASDAKIKEILTPEQITKFEAFKAKMKAEHHGKEKGGHNN